MPRDTPRGWQGVPGIGVVPFPLQNYPYPQFFIGIGHFLKIATVAK